MSACRDNMVITATLDNVRHGSAIDLKIGGKVPAEIRRSDDNEATIWLSRGIAKRDCRKEDKNQQNSADIAV